MNTRAPGFPGITLLALAATLLMVGCGGGGSLSNSQTQAPAVSLSANSLTFPSTTDGTPSAAQTITVTNSGNATLNISSVTPGGNNAADFTGTTTCGSVAAGGTCTISVVFTPSIVGAESATLSIASDAASSPNSVTLAGTGASSTGANGNSVAALVDAGPAALANPALNIMYVSVTICAPGSTTNCQTIDHMQVDTGSSGVRVLSEVLNASLASALTAKTTTAGAGHSLVECTQFGDGYSWGPIKAADVTIGSKTVAGLSIQVIGDASVPATLAPASCLTGPGGATEEDTVAAFGANGIIGLSVFLQDCGSGCPGDGTAYSDCTASACAGYAASTTEQLQNPVSQFAADNNGVVITLPSVTGAGGTNVAGTVTFGVATETNNAIPGTATVLNVNPGNGEFSVNLAGTTLPSSFIDSGSNAYFFPNVTSPTLATCPSPNTSFYCPASDTAVASTITSFDNISRAANFTVQSLANAGSTVTAFGGLAGNLGTFATSMDYGLPFFYGKSIYVIFEQSTAGSASGPAVAF